MGQYKRSKPDIILGLSFKQAALVRRALLGWAGQQYEWGPAELMVRRLEKKILDLINAATMRSNLEHVRPQQGSKHPKRIRGVGV